MAAASPAPIRVAIVGVGNCASALVQGVHYYGKQGVTPCTGVTYPLVGGYGPGDICFVAAWDVDARKVGVPLNEAIFASPNCCWPIDASVREVAGSPRVRPGPLLDGVAPHMLAHEPAERSFRLAAAAPDSRADVVGALREARADVLINYLPVGSQVRGDERSEANIHGGSPPAPSRLRGGE